MASINEKLNYINETKSLIKDKLNDLGSEIENETTFREYAEKIEDLYEEWPKIQGSGSSILLTSTKKGKIISQINGDIFQQTYTGKNLLRFPYSTVSRTYKGVTWTINNDCSITIDGTATGGDSLFNLYFSNTTNLINDTENQYTFYTGVSTTSTNVKRVAGEYINGTMNYYNDISANIGSIFTTSENASGQLFRLSVENGKKVDNIRIYPMIIKGNYTSTETTYEPYVGGTASPNSEFPQEIQSVTGNQEIVVCGKNLFDINSCPILEYTFYDGKGNPVSWAGTCGIREYIKLDENSTYAIKYNGNNNFLICFYDENKTYLSQLIKASGGNFTMPSTAKYIRFGIATAIANVEWCQLEKGSTVTTYETYNGEAYTIHLDNIELFEDDYITGTSNNWSVVSNYGVIQSYNGETIINNYISTTGQLTTGAKIVYELDTPITTPITDTTLINDLNVFYYAMSKNGETNISINGNLPIILDVNVLKKNS